MFESESGVQVCVYSGGRLRVAEVQAEPERDAVLEVPRPAGPVLLRQRWRLHRQLQPVDLVVPGAGAVVVEQDRRLVVARVAALVADGIEDLGAQGIAIVTGDERSLLLRLGGESSGIPRPLVRG